MTLKEDYDYTCSHLKTYGTVCRFNRLILHADHYCNAGGAVAVRNVTTEKRNIKILRDKWPGVFWNSRRGATEVLLRWEGRDVSLGGASFFFENPKHKGARLSIAEANAKAMELGLFEKYGMEIPDEKSLRERGGRKKTKKTKANKKKEAEDTFEVKAIVGHRTVEGGAEYLVHWGDGWTDTWEPEGNLDCSDMIKEFQSTEKDIGTNKENNEDISRSSKRKRPI